MKLTLTTVLFSVVYGAVTYITKPQGVVQMKVAPGKISGTLIGKEGEIVDNTLEVKPKKVQYSRHFKNGTGDDKYEFQSTGSFEVSTGSAAQDTKILADFVKGISFDIPEVKGKMKSSTVN